MGVSFICSINPRCFVQLSRELLFMMLTAWFCIFSFAFFFFLFALLSLSISVSFPSYVCSLHICFAFCWLLLTLFCSNHIQLALISHESPSILTSWFLVFICQIVIVLWLFPYSGSCIPSCSDFAFQKFLGCFASRRLHFPVVFFVSCLVQFLSCVSLCFWTHLY